MIISFIGQAKKTLSGVIYKGKRVYGSVCIPLPKRWWRI
jgi:hypothetical protein